jgi:hypothetical protein
MQCFCYAPKVDHLGGNMICIVMHLQQVADKGGLHFMYGRCVFVRRLAHLA